MSTITDLQGSFTLNNGVEMPYFGLGVYLAETGGEVEQAVHWALEAGYRHIDTASIYRNEAGVGKALSESNVPRDEVFITTKVWNADQGFQSTLDAFQASMDRLQLDYLDLYLIHWPVAGKYKETWKALEQLYRDGKVRAIGVSNFMIQHLKDVMDGAEVVPMVNQMEFHPYLIRTDLREFCQQHHIQYEAWSPLMQGKAFDLPELKALADKYGKNIAQVLLRWDLQKGVITIPKSTKQHRIVANSDIFDFEISPEDVAQLDAMDRDQRFGPDPDNFDF
ncbi:Aldo/keto reductase [Robiginitalea myxolifaciens]|uniref:Aldo/keto reductase n=1 Tax=Robiginitalea myxolifaciens TaxID=400055 RepID=A0A1I6G1R0_9FLAO|nr:aldo/keto reductase [Robiginitalea myxolifaciens]SFR36119.1 Aldo/keto reductase [Robiginitalea myxolifaciens]